MSTTTEETTMGLLSIADPSGDTRIMWDPRNPEEVDTAKAAFKKAKEQGMLAYRVGEEGDATGEVITEFPKKAGKIIMTRQLVGG
jgi:hypothetical protein